MPCGAGLLAGSVDLRVDVSACTAPLAPSTGRRPAWTPVLPARGARHTGSSWVPELLERVLEGELCREGCEN